MEVHIGVVYTPKELSLEFDGTAEEVVALIDKSLTGGDSVVWLTDVKGRRIGVPVDKIAYVEVDSDDGSKRVGFGR
jgi:Protein of unknown function (DUF3107)